MTGFRRKWFETQLAGPFHDFEAGPAEHEVRLALSDGLISRDDQLNDFRSTTKATYKRADKQALGPCTPNAQTNDNDVSSYNSTHGELPPLKSFDAALAIRDIVGSDNANPFLVEMNRLARQISTVQCTLNGT